VTSLGKQSSRARVFVRGAVQGVGFRPFVYRLARKLGVAGWVMNSPQGVVIEVEGNRMLLDQFLLRLASEKPERASIQGMEPTFLDPVGYDQFIIRESDVRGEKSALVLPDISTCPDCTRELFDPANRRYLYPFTNCTNCGPRFTIVESLPYDRPNTSMKAFEMCEECRREFENPDDRRFHAQPNACRKCGPHVELWDERGEILALRDVGVSMGVACVRNGGILAVKGLGGFHLIVNAQDDNAVRRLRKRKRREEKPLALMYPNLEHVESDCELSDIEERLLRSPESPIVLLRRKRKKAGGDRKETIAPGVAPGNPYLGVMLPYTPLHHILLRRLAMPVVATSGNISDEPICTDEREALARLNGIADMFLIHNRPIVRHVDDSVARIMMGRELILRRARGYAPMPVPVKSPLPGSVLAVGAHLKNTVAVTRGTEVFLSQHIGDLESAEAMSAFRRAILDFRQLYELPLDTVACDLHPDYLSTKYARELSTSVHTVQHHYAHVAACMAENELEENVLGVSWDGTGYGLDGTIWGGEFLLADETSFRRVATFRSFPLPGGERAIKEPRRAALGLLYEVFGDSLFQRDDLPPLQSFTAAELRTLHQMILKGVNSPVTSSVGRLFDAVASIIGLRQAVAFEGQAAMELEFLADAETKGAYEYDLVRTPRVSEELASFPSMSDIEINWMRLIRGVLDDIAQGIRPSVIAGKFHQTLCGIILRVAEEIGEPRIVLTGGCFQNRILSEGTIQLLRAKGFRPYWHQRVPPNDGGIALGQVYALSRLLRHPDERRQEKAALSAEESR
jgi:hydrogenase maturation protein HypF